MRRGSRGNNGFIGQNLKQNTTQGVVTSNKDIQKSESTWNRWIRPSNWLSMPDMTAGDQRIALLAAVAGPTGNTANASSLFALSVSGCTYTVDWGNGFTQSYASNSVASYGIYYDELPASTTVKPDFAFQLTGFNFDEFNGYRQALVQVYPTVAGTTFAGFHLRPTQVTAGENARFPNLAYRAAEIAPDWISCKFASPTLTNAVFRSSNTLREVEIVGSTGITNATSMFRSCFQLKKVSGTEWCRNVSSFEDTFGFCYNLVDVPLLNTSSASKMNSMFQYCTSLQTVPQFDMKNTVTTNSMFSNCYQLTDVPLFAMSSVQDFSSMFTNCYSLKTIPKFNTKNVKNFTTMFNECRSLVSIPDLDFSSGTTFTAMFFKCHVLEEANVSSATSMNDASSVFNQCFKLKKVTLPSTNNITNATSMFNTCNSLQSIYMNLPFLNTATNMFSNCHSLADVNLTNISNAGLLVSSMFSNCSNLQRIRLNGIVQGPLDLSGATVSRSLSPDALNELYESLGTPSTAKTLTVTGNWGFQSSNRSIATAKGWLVV